LKHSFFRAFNTISTFFLLVHFYNPVSLYALHESPYPEDRIDQKSAHYIFSEKLKNFIEKYSLDLEQIDLLTLLEALKLLQKEKALADLDSLIQEIESILNDPGFDASKALRPNGSVTGSDAIVSCNNTCDLTQVMALLGVIKKRIVELSQIICDKFEQTWTILGEIDQDIFDTRTILCAKLESTFTSFEAIEQEIIDTRTILCNKFEQTWTILGEIDQDIFDTRTILCAKFDGTFTSLEAIEQEVVDTRTILCDKFEQTWTILAEIDQDIFDTRTILCAKFDGTFTELEAISEEIGTLSETFSAELANTLTIICDKFEQTWTILAEIDQDIFDTRTILCAKFEGTFTSFEAIEQEIIDTRTILCNKFEQTWTILGEINQDIFDTRTILCDKFEQTWTILGEIDQDIFDTKTILCAKFDGTFTVLASLVSGTVTVDFNNVFTSLEQIAGGICNPILIHQSDVGITTFTISSPGLYVFAENIEFNPVGEGQPAIEIISDNVTVDLCGKFLLQNNSVAGIDGFRVQGGSSTAPRFNVTIRNGLVKKFTRSGISVGPNSVVPGDNACQKIFLNHLGIVECELRGMELIGSATDKKIQRGEIISCIILESCKEVGADNAFTFSLCNTLAINGCQIDRCGTHSVNFTGFKISECLKCNFDAGLISCCEGLTFTGVVLDVSAKCIVSNFLIQGNSSIDYFGGIVTTTAGTGLFDRGNRIENSLVTFGESINGPLAGYDLLPGGVRIIVAKCGATNNLVTGTLLTSNCVGFNLDQVNNCCIEDCRASFNRATGNSDVIVTPTTVLNYGAGFNVSTTGPAGTGVKNSQLLRNIATRNDGPTDTFSFGFRTISPTGGNQNNAYLSNVAVRNGPVSPINFKQIIQTSGGGMGNSSPGGVPNASVRDAMLSTLNGQGVEFSNLRIV
jgi:hypothetical protein